MQRYLAQRLWQLPLVLLSVSAVVFSVMHLIPGDPAQLLLGFENTDPVQLARVRREFGLDRPIPVQYAIWLGRILRGELGTSVRTGRPIAQVIAEALPFTLELALYALVLAVAIGIPLGVWAGTERSRSVDMASQAFVLLGLSLPSFWVGTVLILVFSVRLRWFPILSYPRLVDDPLQNLWSLLLPALTLAVPNAAAIARMVLASMRAVRSGVHFRVASAQALTS